MHFPSILYLLDQERRDGAEVVVVPSDDGIAVDTQRIVDAIDERTAVVCLSHVLFKSAYIHDVAAIAEKARRVGAITVIDGYQAVGTIPVDVRALGIDVYIGGCLKWLCGGPGAAFLWADPDVRRRLEPRLTGWMSHQQAVRVRDRARPPRRCLAVAARHPQHPGPVRGPAGPGDHPSRPGSRRSAPSRCGRPGGCWTWPIGAGYRCTTPRDPARRGGTVAIDVENGYEISQSLKSLDILCDYRPGAGIRLSPHFYTRDRELDDGDRGHRRRSGRPGPGGPSPPAGPR